MPTGPEPPKAAANGEPDARKDDELFSCLLGLRTWLRAQVQAEVAGQLAVQVEAFQALRAGNEDLAENFAAHVEEQAARKASLDEALAQQASRITAAEVILTTDVAPTLDAVRKEGLTLKAIDERIAEQASVTRKELDEK